MTSPYSDLPKRAYWRTAVSDRSPLDPGEVYQPRFAIAKDMKIATAGSCFAQHVGRALRQADFHVIDAEPKPPGLPDSTAQNYGYGLYSARYGNVYTTRQLVQLMREAQGSLVPQRPVWEKDGRFFDAFRPGVEPGGLDSPELVGLHRAAHLKSVVSAFAEADLFVFTLGLTEAWVHRDSETVYPTAPGTIAGKFDAEVFSFRNFDYAEVLEDFLSFRSLMLNNRKRPLKFLVTVSPVPLTATASGQHVEVATCYSKSVLRAVCGKLYDSFDDIDYFPSFEIITSQNARGAYYEANKRNVAPEGVATAMRVFLQAHGSAAPKAEAPASPAGGRKKRGKKAGSGMKARAAASDENLVCEEALLEAFAR